MDHDGPENQLGHSKLKLRFLIRVIFPEDDLQQLSVTERGIFNGWRVVSFDETEALTSNNKIYTGMNCVLNKDI